MNEALLLTDAAEVVVTAIGITAAVTDLDSITTAAITPAGLTGAAVFFR